MLPSPKTTGLKVATDAVTIAINFFSFATKKFKLQNGNEFTLNMIDQILSITVCEDKVQNEQYIVLWYGSILRWNHKPNFRLQSWQNFWILQRNLQHSYLRRDSDLSLAKLWGKGLLISTSFRVDLKWNFLDKIAKKNCLTLFHWQRKNKQLKLGTKKTYTNTWLTEDMKLLFEYSTWYLTRSLSSTMRDQVENKKRNSKSPSIHVLFR